MSTTKVYTLGRGMLLFRPVGETGFEDFGNVKDFSLTVETEKLEHYSTASGIKVKDAEIVKSQDFNVSFEIDELRIETLEKFVLASRTDANITAGSVTDEAINSVKQGFWYKLAHEKIKRTPAPVVTDDASSPTTYTENVDYVIDYEAGAIYIVPDGNITDGTNLKIDYSYDAMTKTTLQSGEKYQIVGTLWFKGDPPKGQVLDVIGDVSLTPSGELKLIGDDWLSVKFEGTFTSKPRIISRGVR
jgi:hypothetical protein